MRGAGDGVASDGLIFRVHAIRRMARRGISVDDVRRVLEAGETIEEYPDDDPYPSRLMLGWSRGHAIHVVAATALSGETYVITVYEPESIRWMADLRTRRPQP